MNGRRLRRLVSLALLSGCGWAAAGGTHLEAFDHANCRIWRLSDEIIPEQTPMLASQRRLVDASLQRARSRQVESQLLAGTVSQPQRRAAEPEQAVGTVFCVAAAATDASATHTVLECFASDGEQVEHTAFRARTRQRSQERPPTYRCTAPCNARSVTQVHELAWEDGPENLEHGGASRRFRARCGR